MFEYKCPGCGYTEERLFAITRYTQDKLCPDCEGANLKPKSMVELAERTRTNNYKRYFSRKPRKKRQKGRRANV